MGSFPEEHRDDVGGMSPCGDDIPKGDDVPCGDDMLREDRLG